MSRRMIRYMNLMHFPRYVHTESRDFFYLTARPLLPLTPLEVKVQPRELGEGVWQTKGLPQHGWPPAIASTQVRPDPSHPNTRVTLLAIDAKWLQVAKATDPVDATIIAFEPNDAHPKSTSLWYLNGTLQIQVENPGSAARRLASGFEDASHIGRAQSAIGQLDGQIWVYLEVSGSSDHSGDFAILERVMREVGANRRLYFGQTLSVKTWGNATLSPTATRFIRQEGPHGQRIFQDTPIVPASEWIPLQEKRLRYMKRPKAARPTPDIVANSPTTASAEKYSAGGQATDRATGAQP
jgi:hypothetical protein